MSTIAIVSPGFPDVAGGVTDHTGRLLRHWREDGGVVQVLGSVGELPDDVAARWELDGVGAVLIQYVPFLYARRGLSPYPRWLARAARARGMRVTVFVHEPWVPRTRLPWLILSPLQRRQLRRLIAASDAVATPVPAWAQMLGPQTKIVRVGSTLGEAPGRLPGREALEGPVVFSPFAAGLRWDWVTQAVSRIGADPPLVVIGADADGMRRHSATRRWVTAEWDCRGRLSASDVMALLNRARVVLAPYLDGITGRRTSAAASLSTGAKLISSTGHLFDEYFSQSPISLAGDAEEFARNAAEAWTSAQTDAECSARRTWYDTHLDPRALDAQLLELVLGGASA